MKSFLPLLAAAALLAAPAAAAPARKRAASAVHKSHAPARGKVESVWGRALAEEDDHDHEVRQLVGSSMSMSMVMEGGAVTGAKSLDSGRCVWVWRVVRSPSFAPGLRRSDPVSC